MEAASETRGVSFDEGITLKDFSQCQETTFGDWLREEFGCFVIIHHSFLLFCFQYVNSGGSGM